MTDYSTYDDKGLLKKLAKNDESAFSEIYNRYWKKLFAMAVNRIKDKADAEDVVHDVFTGLWYNRCRVHITTLENYLAVAVKYTILNVIRKKRYEEHYLQTAIGALEPEPLLDDKIHYSWLLQKVQSEVEKLPEKCRLVFTQSRYQDMPVKEIARQLHISPKTVENHLTKAANHLRLAFKSTLLFFLLFLISLLF